MCKTLTSTAAAAVAGLLLAVGPTAHAGELTVHHMIATAQAAQQFRRAGQQLELEQARAQAGRQQAQAQADEMIRVDAAALAPLERRISTTLRRAGFVQRRERQDEYPARYALTYSRRNYAHAPEGCGRGYFLQHYVGAQLARPAAHLHERHERGRAVWTWRNRAALVTLFVYIPACDAVIGSVPFARLTIERWRPVW